jgi:predicted AlkP superfamily pyrophosphatase or phosphodiesterase
MRLHAFARLSIGALALAMSGCGSAAEPKPVEGAAVFAATPSVPPRLVVVISVDQFSADLFAQYRQHFTGGLGRLLQGAVFPSAYQSHAATETCPGHSTLLTGTHPARTGIIANDWMDLSLSRSEKKVYCVEDLNDPASSPNNPVVSANLLKVPTLGEHLKRANAESRNVAVSAKDRAAIMMGGHDIDQVYWFKGGSFVTLKGRPLDQAAEAENASVGKTIAAGGSALALPNWCAPRDRALNLGKMGEIGRGRFSFAAGSASDFKTSPRMDAATLALAKRLVDEMKLGRRAAPDLLSISLSATDYIGHAFGNEGAEMCIQMAELDRSLGAFFAGLDKAGIDYMVVLTADHGALDTPERQDQQANPNAARIDPALNAKSLGDAIGAQLGISPSDGLLRGEGLPGDLYVSRALTPDQKSRVIQALVARLQTHPQVAAVFTAEELAKSPMPAGSPQDWTLRDRARANFDPQRSGDVIVLLNRGVVGSPAPRPGSTATHGSPWDYDRRVPLLFWRKGMAGFEQPAPVETVDIAPTLAALLGLKLPERTFDGRCLDLDGGEGNTCGNGR